VEADYAQLNTDNTFLTPNTQTFQGSNASVGLTAPLVISNSQTSQLFTNLVTGTYTIGVQDNSGCNYIQEATIYAENKFTISTEITGTTCNQNNGTVLVIASTGGELPYDYSLDGLVNVIDTNLNQITFTNVSSGQHNVTVTDASGCVQSSQIYVPSSQPLDFSLYSTSCGNGNSGLITTFINSGTAPFTFNWSDNVPNNPQQIQVTGLTAGTYSVTVTDNYGCSLKRTTTIDCATNYTSFQTYVMGSEVFNIQSPTKCSLLHMMNEGYLDLTSGNTNCNLISAIFTAKVSVNPLGLSTSNTFFTSTSLITVPADNLWYDTIKNLLLSVSGVGNVIINQLNNQITIETIKGDNSLSGQEIIIELVIVYDIMCLT
jgi:plastocyanin